MQQKDNGWAPLILHGGVPGYYLTIGTSTFGAVHTLQLQFYTIREKSEMQDTHTILNLFFKKKTYNKHYKVHF